MVRLVHSPHSNSVKLPAFQRGKACTFFWKEVWQKPSDGKAGNTPSLAEAGTRVGGDAPAGSSQHQTPASIGCLGEVMQGTGPSTDQAGCKKAVLGVSDHAA